MDDVQQASPRRTIELAFGFEMALAVVALVIGRLCGVWPLESLYWSVNDLGLGLLATAPLVIVLLLGIWKPIGPFRRIMELVHEFVGLLFAQATTIDVVAIAAAAGFGEELLFRGVVQAGVERLSGSPWLAIAVGAVVFGAAHPITRMYAILAAVIGAYFGWLFVATGNLLVPIVAHGAYDLLAILAFLRTKKVSGTKSVDLAPDTEMSVQPFVDNEVD